MTSPNSLQQYEECINRVINFMCRNIADELSLDELSKVACFSKYHFLRIFKAVVGETAGDFIRRIRIEKAAYFLIYNLSASITRIALDCGFSSSQNFAKSFKLYYGCSPREFRARSSHIPFEEKSNPGNMLRNAGKESDKSLGYIDIVDGAAVHLETDTTVASQVTVEHYPDTNVIYVRKNENYIPKTIGAAFTELFNWASPRGLITDSAVPCAVYWDNVAVTPTDKRRFDVCLPAPQSIAVSPPVHRQTITGGSYAVYHTLIENYEFYYHWNRFLKFWFPSSGFIPDDRPCFERIFNIFDKNHRHKLKVDICVPIKPL